LRAERATVEDLSHCDEWCACARMHPDCYAHSATGQAQSCPSLVIHGQGITS